MKKIWQREPAWLQKKRQLATQLMPRFSTVNEQEQWLSAWRDNQPEPGEGWLTSEHHNIIALPLAVAVNKYPELLQENLMEKALRWQDNQLNAAHLASLDCGQFIYISNAGTVNKKVRFAPQGGSTNPHNVIIIGNDVSITIEETFTNKAEKPTFAATEILVGANAQVTYRQANNYEAPLVFQAIHAYQAHGSNFKLELANTTSNNVHTSLYSFLDGSNTIWDATVGLRTTNNGQQILSPVVDGFGRATRAHFTTFSQGKNINIAPFKTGSGEPLAITTKKISEQDAPKWLRTNMVNRH